MADRQSGGALRKITPRRRGHRAIGSCVDEAVEQRIREIFAEQFQPEPLAREGEHVPPTFLSEAFHCAWCGVLATQGWKPMFVQEPTRPTPVWRVVCRNCNNWSYWLEEEAGNIAHHCLFPVTSGGPRPHPSTPQDVRADYEEARAIVQQSPRGACALLRLAAQKLVDEHLQTGSGNLNKKIGQLVEDGLPPGAQQALDALRVIGNEAVHPGTLDLRDDVETATGLFNLLNFVVDDRIERPKRIAEMYAKLPGDKLEQIQRRDAAAEEDS